MNLDLERRAYERIFSSLPLISTSDRQELIAKKLAQITNYPGSELDLSLRVILARRLITLHNAEIEVKEALANNPHAAELLRKLNGKRS